MGLLLLFYFLRRMGRGDNPVPRGVSPPAPWSLFIGLVLAFAWYLLQGSAVGLAMHLGVRWPVELSLIGKVVGAAVAGLFLAQLVSESAGRRPRAKGAVVGLVGMFALLPVVLAVLVGWRELLHLFGRSWTQQQVLKELGTAPLWASALIAVVLAPFAEEVVFRGVLYTSLRRSAGKWVAVYGSAALFMLAHDSVSVAPAIFILGVAFAWLYERTGTLVTSMAFHAAFNAWNLLGTHLSGWIHPCLPWFEHWLRGG